MLAPRQICLPRALSFDESEQVDVDLILMRGRDAVRRARAVDLPGAPSRLQLGRKSSTSATADAIQGLFGGHQHAISGRRDLHRRTHYSIPMRRAVPSKVTATADAALANCSAISRMQLHAHCRPAAPVGRSSRSIMRHGSISATRSRLSQSASTRRATENVSAAVPPTKSAVPGSTLRVTRNTIATRATSHARQTNR